jgi:hypothetical protein
MHQRAPKGNFGELGWLDHSLAELVLSRATFSRQTIDALTVNAHGLVAALHCNLDISP